MAQPNLFDVAEETFEGVGAEIDSARSASHILTGEIRSILLRDEGSGLVVGTLQATDRATRVRFVGRELPGIEEGAFVRFEGEWTHHPKYGRQFNVRMARARLPLLPDAVLRYIKANIKGCGPTYAKRIVDTLGVSCLEILARDPERIAEVFREGKLREKQLEVWTRWASSYVENQAAEDLYVRLMGAEGITIALARRIVRHFGVKEAERIALYHPYELVQVPGIGFRTADAIARGMGIALDDPTRIAAGIVYTLEKAMDEGHSALTRSKLERRAKKILEIDNIQSIRDAIGNALRVGTIVEREGLVFTAEVDALEDEVAHAFARLAQREICLTPEQCAVIESVIAENNLSTEQADAVRRALRHALFVLTGRPGTGKTTALATYLRCCEALGWGEDVAIVAPTGRAASRAAEVTGYPASTIHRLIGGRGRRRKGLLPYRRIVLDEGSMCDLATTAWLLRHIDLEQTSLLIVGDQNQLPSVGHGRVLGDLLDSGVVQTAYLRKIFRQGEGSLIVVNAHRVLDRKPLELRNGSDSDFLFVDITRRAELGPDGFPVDDPERSRKECEEGQQRIAAAIRYLINQKKANPVRDIQVLAPMRRGLLGVSELNALIQDIVNPKNQSGPLLGDGTFVRLGDRVIQIKNDYDLGVYNGDQGEVVEILKDGRVVVDFDKTELRLEKHHLKNLWLSWAISVHRAQGSEYPYVIMAYHTSHHIMHSLSLLYTGITRARKQLILVGNRQALDLTLRRGHYADERYTMLSARLKEILGGERKLSWAA